MVGSKDKDVVNTGDALEKMNAEVSKRLDSVDSMMGDMSGMMKAAKDKIAEAGARSSSEESRDKHKAKLEEEAVVLRDAIESAEDIDDLADDPTLEYFGGIDVNAKELSISLGVINAAVEDENGEEKKIRLDVARIITISEGVEERVRVNEWPQPPLKPSSEQVDEFLEQLGISFHRAGFIPYPEASQAAFTIYRAAQDRFHRLKKNTTKQQG